METALSSEKRLGNQLETQKDNRVLCASKVDVLPQKNHHRTSTFDLNNVGPSRASFFDSLPCIRLEFCA